MDIKKSMIADFNPRPREGSDSIVQKFDLYMIYFNPRPREGSDAGKVDDIAKAQQFQSTPP